MKKCTKMEFEQDTKKYGSLLRRFYSFLIDSAMIVIVFLLAFNRSAFSFFGKLDISGPNAGREFFMISTVFSLVFAFLMLFYGTFFIGKYGSTLGQKLCKLKVLTVAGKELGYKKAFLRGLAFLIYYIPYITMVFTALAVTDKKNQAIHDKMCNTIVVNVPR